MPKENIKNKEHHCTIWGKLGTALQGYTLNPCSKLPPNPTSTKVNTDELTFEHSAKKTLNLKKITVGFWGKLGTAIQRYTLNTCTRFPPNTTSTKVNTDELTLEHPVEENIKKQSS